MNRERSWTRVEYEIAYRHFRRDGGESTKSTQHPIDEEIWKAADYSYQAWGYEPTGWTSDRRYKRFLEIKWRVLSSGEYLPF